MRYIHGVQTIIEVPFKKKSFLCTFLMSLSLFNGHLLSALPTSADPHGAGVAFTASIPPLETSVSVPVSSIADLLHRGLSDSTITVQDRPTLTVNVVDVSIVNLGGTPVPEANNAPLTPIFVSPVGPSPSKANGLDIVFSAGSTATAVTASTTTLVMTSTMADPAGAPSSIFAAASTRATKTPRNGHIIFECIALTAISILTGMLTSRLIAIYPYRYRLLESGEHALRWLVLIISLFGLFFLFSSVMLIDVWDDDSASRCYAASLICLIFYFGVKVFEYLFMIERAHQLRRRESLSHLDDSWYLFEFLTLIVGFGVIVFFAFKDPEGIISPVDGLCRIGLPPRVAISVLAFDVVLNILLVVHYCILAWRVSPMKNTQEVVRYLCAALPFRKLQAASNEHQEIRKFHIGRVIWGLVAITIPTVANLYTMAYVHGHEQGWLCFSVCTGDITWGVIIIHWLTSKPSYSHPPVQRLPGPGAGLRSHYRAGPHTA